MYYISCVSLIVIMSTFVHSYHIPSFVLRKSNHLLSTRFTYTGTFHSIKENFSYKYFSSTTSVDDDNNIMARCTKLIQNSLAHVDFCKVSSTNDDPNGSHVSFYV